MPNFMPTVINNARKRKSDSRRKLSVKQSKLLPREPNKSESRSSVGATKSKLPSAKRNVDAKRKRGRSATRRLDWPRKKNAERKRRRHGWPRKPSWQLSVKPKLVKKLNAKLARPNARSARNVNESRKPRRKLLRLNVNANVPPKPRPQQLGPSHSSHLRRQRLRNRPLADALYLVLLPLQSPLCNR